MNFINGGNLKEFKILDDLPWNEPINKNQNIQRNENYKLVSEKITMKTKKVTFQSIFIKLRKLLKIRTSVPNYELL